MILQRRSKATLTPFHLDHGDTLQFTLSTGREWEMRLLDTRAEITAWTKRGGDAQDASVKNGDIAVYTFDAVVRVNGREIRLHREVGTSQSFYHPWCVDGVRIWLDAVARVFETRGGFLGEKDASLGFICQPPKQARFVVQEEGCSICPEPLHLWYPNAERRIDIRDCYHGENCWMGPYSGGAAHCGLDVNMPAGTVLSAPIAFDNHYLFASTAAGYTNNRWRGIRRWPDGSEWWLQCHHQIDMLVPVGTPLAAGTPYATGAGVAVGAHEHSHFMFRVLEQGGDYLLDPWILFGEMFRQR